MQAQDGLPGRMSRARGGSLGRQPGAVGSTLALRGLRGFQQLHDCQLSFPSVLIKLSIQQPAQRIHYDQDASDILRHA